MFCFIVNYPNQVVKGQRETVAYLFLRVEKKEEKRQKKGAEALKVVE